MHRGDGVTRLLPLLLLLGCAPPAPPDWPLPQWEHAGAPVVYEAATLPGPVAVRLVGGLCVVEWDPERWEALSPAQRVLAVAHEIGHCRLVEAGHGEAEPWALELAADCWAVSWAVRADYLPARWEAELVGWLLDWPESLSHPGGAERAAALMECAARARGEQER